MGPTETTSKRLRTRPLINASTIRKTKVFEDECSEDKKYKEGKTVINTTISNENGDGEKDYTLTIEGKDGKITLIAESVQDPDKKLRLPLDKFEEKK